METLTKFNPEEILSKILKSGQVVDLDLQDGVTVLQLKTGGERNAFHSQGVPLKCPEGILQPNRSSASENQSVSSHMERNLVSNVVRSNYRISTAPYQTEMETCPKVLQERLVLSGKMKKSQSLPYVGPHGVPVQKLTQRGLLPHRHTHPYAHTSLAGLNVTEKPERIQDLSEQELSINPTVSDYSTSEDSEVVADNEMITISLVTRRRRRRPRQDATVSKCIRQMTLADLLDRDFQMVNPRDPPPKGKITVNIESPVKKGREIEIVDLCESDEA